MKIETKRLEKDGKPLSREIREEIEDLIHEFDVITGKRRVMKAVLNQKKVSKEDLDKYFLEE